MGICMVRGRRGYDHVVGMEHSPLEGAKRLPHLPLHRHQRQY